MSEIQYKCPSCSAPIEYSPTKAKMACEYCGSTFEVAEVEQFNAQLLSPVPGAGPSPVPGVGVPGAAAGTSDASGPATPLPGSAQAGEQWKSSSPTYIDESEIASMTMFVCNSCGAEIVADPTTISTRCGFCNNTFVASSRIRETRIPDFIIPFALDKKGMLAAFERATTGKFLLPKEFRDTHTLSEATGAYIPYWYHDGTASGTITYRATNTRSWSDSEYDYTETDVYEVTRSASATFRGIPVCATTKLEPTRAEGAEPFNLVDSKSFATPYLSGYAASSYDIDAKATIDRADDRAKKTLSKLIRGTVTGYSSVQQKSEQLFVQRDAVWYALLPVWLIVIGYEGKQYPFAINGQTGEVVGSFPISQKKLRALHIGFFTPFLALFAVIGWYLMYLLAN